MEKTIIIDDKPVRFIATASTLRRYRAKFPQRDLITDVELLINSAKKGQLTPYDLETFEDMAYIMAKQGNDEIPDDINEWLDGFSMFSVYDILPELLTLWNDSRVTQSEAKKNNVVQKGA